MATLFFFVLGATFLINNVLAGMSTSYCAQGTGGCHEHFETTFFQDSTGTLSLDDCAAKCNELGCKSFNHGKPGVARENWCNVYPVACTSAGDSDWNNYLPASDDRCTHEYEVVKTGGLTFSQAQAHCETTYGTNLATIWNDADARYLLDTAKNTLGGYAWIGLNDVDAEGGWLFESRQFECVEEYGAGGCDAAYPYWHVGEPNDVGANEDCAHVRVEATEIWDMLNDHTCTWTGTSGFFCDASRADAAAVGGWLLGDIANSNRGAENYYSNGEYPSWFLYGGVSLLVLLLAVNLVMMTYVNCCKKTNSRRAYQVVKFADSDVDQSAALPINV